MIPRGYFGLKHLSGEWDSRNGIHCRVKSGKVSLNKESHTLVYHKDENGVNASLSLIYNGLIIFYLNGSQENLLSYHPDLRKVANNLGNRQIMELAPGLKKFIPSVSEKAALKPLVVESLNYNVITELLHYGKPLFLPHHQDYADELSDRCGVMMDKDKVRIVGHSLMEALDNPQLFETVDILVNIHNFSDDSVARGYGIRREALRHLELRLLRDGGIRYGTADENPLVKRKGRFEVWEK